MARTLTPDDVTNRILLIITLITTIPSGMLLYAAWTQPSWIIRGLFTALAAIPIAMLMEQFRFILPIGWRLRWPKWDAFLCRVGSHRCVPICGSRCCWECIRCEPNSRSVKAYFERLERLEIKR